MLIVCALAAGCQPLGTSTLDEEKDPNYLTGRSRQTTGDYRGAAAAYEKALTTNPRSAAAHKALGLIYAQHLGDPAAAIYHFQKLLELNPKDPHAEILRQHVGACKQELASTAAVGPITPQVQKELARLDEENRRLMGENSNLVAQVVYLRNQLAQRAAVAAQNNPAPTPAPLPPSFSVTNLPGKVMVQPTPPARTNAPPATDPTPPAGADRSQGTTSPSGFARATRTHTVRVGETMSSIARRYGVSPTALQKANPSVNPRKLRQGQVVNVP